MLRALSPLVDGAYADDFVFRGRSAGAHISDQTFRALIKWIASDVLGHDPKAFSCPSTRRTGAAHIYRATCDVALVAKLLGHTRFDHTSRYLGLEESAALEAARRFEL